MASVTAVSAALKVLGRVFAGEITAEKVALYSAALEDVPDAQIAASVATLIKRHTGQFLPVPAQIREACGANSRPILDLEAARRSIVALGSYGPVAGWCAPSVETVRQKLGDAMADAYGAIGGGAQLFPRDNETGRSIAVREFGRELAAATERVERLALPDGSAPKMLRGEAA